MRAKFIVKMTKIASKKKSALKMDIVTFPALKTQTVYKLNIVTSTYFV